MWANFQRIIELFTKTIVKKFLKIWSWDPGVKKAPDPGSGSATLIILYLDRSKNDVQAQGETSGHPESS